MHMFLSYGTIKLLHTPHPIHLESTKQNETKENYKRHGKTAMEREVAEMPEIAEAEMLVNEWIHEMPEICTWI